MQAEVNTNFLNLITDQQKPLRKVPLTSINFIKRGKTGFLLTAIRGKCGHTSGTTTVAGRDWCVGYSTEFSRPVTCLGCPPSSSPDPSLFSDRLVLKNRPDAATNPNLDLGFTGRYLYAFTVLTIPTYLCLSFLTEICLMVLQAEDTRRLTSYVNNHFEQTERQHKPDNIIRYKLSRLDVHTI
jgi:hypothetical protein